MPSHTCQELIGGRQMVDRKVEVVSISKHGLWLAIDEKEVFLSFEMFPWFRNESIGKILHVERLSAQHLSWPELGVDLEVDSILYPERYPLVSRVHEAEEGYTSQVIRLQVQSSSQEAALDLIRSAISAEIRRLELGLETTKRHIQSFEERYQVTSEVFLKNFSAEDLSGGDQEYVAWSGELKLYERIAAQLDTLRNIHYAP